jgi:hypothetical protein
MAHRTYGGIPVKAASQINQWVPVSFLPAGSALSETVYRTGSLGEFSVGLAFATVASPGDPVTLIHMGEVGKGIAGASLGAGAIVAVGSTNGILIPQIPSGLSTALGSAVGAAGLRWSVGIALKNAAAGDIFPVYVKPDQII